MTRRDAERLAKQFLAATCQARVAHASLTMCMLILGNVDAPPAERPEEDWMADVENCMRATSDLVSSLSQCNNDFLDFLQEQVMKEKAGQPGRTPDDKSASER